MTRLFVKAGWIGLFALVLQSCGSSDHHSAKDPFAALNYPPFKDVTDSIKLFPRKPELYLRRALLLSENKFQEIATPDFKKAWELTGDENIELEYISNLLLSGRSALAVQLLRKGAANSSNTEFNRRLGEVYLQNGEQDSAMVQYDKIIALDPSNFEAWYDRGTLLARAKDTAGAIAALEKSFAILPINYSGLALAGIYAVKKDPRALRICDQLLASDSGAVQTEPVYMKGVYYSEAKQYDSAIRQFDLCIVRDWKMTDAYIEKGILYFQQRQTDSALKTFSMAATVSNTDADAYFWIGRCYEAKGDKQQAAANYERAYALDNSLVEARARLDQIGK